MMQAENAASWDNRYRQETYRYGKDPEAFFKKFIGQKKAGRILLPGEGEGRHAVYAAQAGWQVDAVDFSPEAKAKALRLAEEAGVTINYQLSPLESFEAPQDTYDAIALIFVHLPAEERRKLHRRLVSYLKPDGGNLYLMAFSKHQLDYSSGGPRDAALLYSKEELMEDFRDLDLDMVTEEVLTRDAGEGHQGKGAVITLSGVRHVQDTSGDRVTLDLG